MTKATTPKKEINATNPADPGIVSKCNVTNCTYYEEQQCTAGSIDVTFVDDLALCYTYTLSETEEQVSSVSVAPGVGDVSQCDVIDCIYNQGQRCTAEYITVTFADGTAQCASYKQVNK